ncbi:hypothetical protein [Acinetobacter nosocomialis]|uniref:hypothetical protein n=1 Tax=Acinetobacter nosocomialis TaxID=106654 RepID=UPI002A36A867|nr:hypothetical protein [Acinetobacter nosocomialis]
MKLFIIIFIAIFSSIGLICLIALLRNLKSYSPSSDHDYSSSTHHLHDNSSNHHHSSNYSNDCSSSSDSGSCDGGGGSD